MQEGLDRLVVIDRLEVGPARVEKKRVVMPYTVVTGSDTDRIDFIYRYEEDVFRADDPASLNLASVAGAQAALNYGLFCKQIVFRGPFTARDRKFLSDAAENTAREIWVNKFLKPNVFLTDSVAALPPVRHESYLNSALVFPDPEPENESALSEGWVPDSDVPAVLSSGGKDSLLSFGLLNEIGLKPHAIFVNESGRHWFTALNAYRHFEKNISNTGRVWTNSDRVFAWMLRHLPFVRRDFSRIRSDEYPIRLWTVAVFLFGALPLLRKRAVGRLVIGNEYDSSTRTSHHGITHYAGLYDQSRWFDNRMTRYFQGKNWGVQQFSILRPLSEMLILEVLVKRYPGLQRHQVSCHAAHRHTDGRIRPCGRCEKCRRVVGMLRAVDADPTRCGYTAEQIRGCLASLVGEGLHQEVAGYHQLLHMLGEAGEIRSDGPRQDAHPEILQLRFDRNRSPFDTIPNELREPLYRIYMEHAAGAVERHGRIWSKCDPLGETSLSMPYRFHRPGRAARAESPGTSARPHVLAELNWPQAQRRFKQVDVALLPVGAIEQHGPHLPLDTDAWDAEHLAQQVAAACSDPRPVVLPLLSYGVSYHHDDFSGTLSVSPETQARLVYEIGMCAARHGITKLVIVNGHGGNGPALHLAAQMINKDAHIFTCVESGETSDTDIYKIVEGHNDVHAGEIETSTSLATRPELVDMSKAPKTVPRFPSGYLDFTSERSVGWYAYTSRISKTGVMGDASAATAEKGREIWKIMITRLTELVEQLKRLSLEEIHQKRY